MTTANNNTYVYVGAETSGIFRLSPGSNQWEELTNGLPSDPMVCGITIHPNEPEVIYAGTQDGPYLAPTGGIPGKDWTIPRLAHPLGLSCSDLGIRRSCI